MKHLAFSVGVVCIITLSVVTLCAGDTSFRCGNSLIQTGDLMYEVRNACGEPYSKQNVGEKKTYRILEDKSLRIESITYLTEWIYKSNNGIYVLTFEGSRLARKEYIYK